MRWEDIKKEIKSISPEETEVIKLISEYVSIREKLYTQRELEKECGIKQSAIARIETFEVVPTLTTFIKLLKPLGLTIKLAKIKE